jgi:predicted DNA-binding transcriptional regulator AlpA
MARKVVSMEELRLEVLLEPERTGESISEVCARRGISRATFYRYRQRLLEMGAEVLEPRTRRPRSFPGQIASWLELEICTLRRRHPRWGARPDPRRAASSRDRSPGHRDPSTRRCAATRWSPPSRPAGARRTATARSRSGSLTRTRYRRGRRETRPQASSVVGSARSTAHAKRIVREADQGRESEGTGRFPQQ